MTDIEEQAIMREVEHIVHRNREFHDPEIRCEMSAAARHLIANGLPDLLTHLRQLCGRKRLEISGRLDRVQDAHGTFPCSRVSENAIPWSIGDRSQKRSKNSLGATALPRSHPSASASGEILRQESQRIRGRTKRGERVRSGAAQAFDLRTRGVHAEDGGICHLPGVLILADRFPDMLGRLRDIEEVIDGLEHQPDRLTPTRDGLKLRRLRASGNRADGACTADECASLLHMNRLEPLERRESSGMTSERVEDLTIDHLRRCRGDRSNNGISMLRCCRSSLECQRKQRIASQDRHGFTESHMHRRTTAPHEIVVERRQIVMDQTECMDHLNGSTSRECIARAAADCLRAAHGQERAEAFSATEKRMPNRSQEVGRIGRRIHMSLEFTLDGPEQFGCEHILLARSRSRHPSKCNARRWHVLRYAPRMEFLWSNFHLLMERGGPVMWPLLVLSIVSVTLTVERIWFWRRMGSRSSRIRLRAMVNALRMNDADTVLVLAEEDNGPFAAVAADLASDGPSDAIAIAAVERQRPRLERFLNILSTIVTAAPMLGILGTVSGIIRSFELLGGKDTLSDPRLVSAGIAEALVATASGLVVALISLFPYMYFRSHSDKAIGVMEGLVASAKLGVERHGGDPDSSLRKGEIVKAPPEAVLS